MNKSKNFLNRRTQMFIVGIIVWILLACWTISAFWGHIEELGESYQFAAKMGALASEVIGLGFVFWHCFDKSITVRKWALIFSVILASVLVLHAGALRGLKDAKAAQTQVEDRLTEKMTEMSKAQAGSVSTRSAYNATQRERLAVAGKNAAAQAEIAKSAQQTVAAEITAGVDKVKDTAIVPRWYLDGWMYAVIFMSAMLMLGILYWQMSNADDIDADYDGVPDNDQYAQFQQLAMHSMTPANQSTMTTRRNGYAIVDENDIAGSLPRNAQIGTKATGPGGDEWVMTPEGWQQAESQAQSVQRPSFMRRVFSGDTQSTAPAAPRQPKDDWINQNGEGSKRSH